MEKLRRELSMMRHRLSDYEGANKVAENKTNPNRLSERRNSERQSSSGLSGSGPSLVEFPDWNEFKFCTKKKGAYGPTEKECLEYYSEK